MTMKISNVLFLALMLTGLGACNSTPQPVENTFALAPAPPPDIEYDLPLEDSIPSTPEPPARICQLGTSCLTMDPRPFEACLLTTKHCKGKAVPMLVGPPVSSAPAPRDASR